MIISTKIQCFNLYVGPRPLTLISSQHPSLICIPMGYTLCHEQEEVLLTMLSAALMLGWGKDES